MGWLPEHDELLAACFAKAKTGAETAAAINGRFGTDYSRNAIIGRALRKGIKTENLPVSPNPNRRKHRKRTPGTHERVYRVSEPKPKPVHQFTCDPITRLRQADVAPLHLTLFDVIDRDGCRWAFGDSNYTFCGHPKYPGFSYCGSHVALSIRPNFERAARRAA